MAQRVGLVVGKFSPLHLGHEALINFAQANCDVLYIISYSNPEFRGCDAWTRYRWLKTRFPKAKLLVFNSRIGYYSGSPLPGGGFDIPPNSAPDGVQRDFLRQVLECYCIEPTVMFSGEDYGPPCANYLGIEYVHYDRATKVSGTLIRQGDLNPAIWCSPVVRASLINRIAVLGAESSGKTTLCEALAEAHNTVWVPEYGREYWEKNAGIHHPTELYHIASEQYRRENSYAFLANRVMFLDTTTATTTWYAKKMFDTHLLVPSSRVDTLVLCLSDFPFVQDGTRNSAWAEEQREFYFGYYKSFQGPKIMVSGTVPERIKQVRVLANV